MRKRAVATTRTPSAFAVEARVRARYQVTLPEPVATALAAQPADRLLFEADPAEPGVVRIRKARVSWAGAAPGVFGTKEEVLEFLREERASWGE
jgi:bifunctional DNA-binding transcriptional regulator/antitoxin component of YhaV-PrlF toxin-antitoxin module